MRHEEYKQLLALEAVGALDAGERDALGEHLPSCAECREELRALADAAASLAYTVAPSAPPPGLRSNVLARVRALTPSEIVAAAPPESRAADAAPPGSRALDLSGSRPGVRDARAALRGFSLWQLLAGRPALGFGAAAAAVALALLGATSLSLWSRNQSLNAEVARLYDRLRATEGELAGQREQLASVRDVTELLAAPGTRVAELSGKKPAPQAHATVAYDRSTGRAVIMATGLPPCPPGHDYQLWLIADNKPLPGGAFKADGEGRARMTDRLPPGHTAPTFAVTLERQGGVPAPQGDVFLVGAPQG
ncbi:MAG TPA: anti-sigma factor [Pyrinomonadaceae bacterium]|jgi:anti-sigma-K factor RskA